MSGTTWNPRYALEESLRALTAAAVLLSAFIHLEMWIDGYRDIETIGPLFMLNAVGGLLLGLVIIGWRHWLPLLGAVGFGAATSISFWISSTRGLFGYEAFSGATNDRMALYSEVAAIICGLAGVALALATVRRGASVRTPTGLHRAAIRS